MKLKIAQDGYAMRYLTKHLQVFLELVKWVKGFIIVEITNSRNLENLGEKTGLQLLMKSEPRKSWTEINFLYNLSSPADHTVLGYQEFKKISRSWVLKLFLQNKNKTFHCTFSKFGLYFWGFFLWFASILNGKYHVAHQIEDFFTRHLKKIRQKKLIWSFLKLQHHTFVQLGNMCTYRTVGMPQDSLFDYCLLNSVYTKK